MLLYLHTTFEERQKKLTLSKHKMNYHLSSLLEIIFQFSNNLSAVYLCFHGSINIYVLKSVNNQNFSIILKKSEYRFVPYCVGFVFF